MNADTLNPWYTHGGRGGPSTSTDLGRPWVCGQETEPPPVGGGRGPEASSRLLGFRFASSYSSAVNLNVLPGWRELLATAGLGSSLGLDF